MKKIVTALGNPILNNELKKYKEFQIMINDIQYQEAIIEFLEIEKNIDYIILNEILPGNISIEELINKIKIKNENIEIIIILEKENKELEGFLYSKKIFNIFYNNKVEIIDVIKILKNKKINNIKIEKDIEMIKDIILNDSNINKQINKIKINNETKKELKSNNKMICVLGSSGVGKSIFSVCFSNYLKNNKNKILIIDFDILNNSIHTILGINKYSKKLKDKIKEKDLNKLNNFNDNNNIKLNKFSQNNYNLNIEDLIISVNKNVDLLTGIDILFNSDEDINEFKLLEMISEIKKQYDYIIVDTSSECFFKYNRILIEHADKNIFLLEANLLEITKAKRLLDMYKNNWKINSNKIKIIINKYNKNSIDLNLLKNIFGEYEMLGKIKMGNFYNSIINKNNNNLYYKKEEKKEYKKIGENILQVNFGKKGYLLKDIFEALYGKLKIKN